MPCIQAVLGDVCLRRTEDMVDFELPPKVDHDVHIEFSTFERDLYQALEEKAQLNFTGFLRRGTVLNNFATVLTMLLRLRQACDHPLLQAELRAMHMAGAFQLPHDGSLDTTDDLPDVPGQSKPGRVMEGGDAMADVPIQKLLKPQVIERIQREALEEHQSLCAICLDHCVRQESVFTKCGHMYCMECIGNYITQRGTGTPSKAPCPVCKDPCREDELVPVLRVLPEKEVDEDVIVIEDDDDDEGTIDLSSIEKADRRIQESLSKLDMGLSSKIEKILELLEEGTRENPLVKTLIFSQWPSFFALLTPVLRKKIIEFGIFDGSMDADTRCDIIDTFKTSRTMNCLLCSLKCAGYGLNLTEASRVILVDPWWNPSLEKQGAICVSFE